MQVGYKGGERRKRRAEERVVVVARGCKTRGAQLRRRQVGGGRVGGEIGALELKVRGGRLEEGTTRLLLWRGLEPNFEATKRQRLAVGKRRGVDRGLVGKRGISKEAVGRCRERGVRDGAGVRRFRGSVRVGLARGTVGLRRRGRAFGIFDT